MTAGTDSERAPLLGEGAESGSHHGSTANGHSVDTHAHDTTLLPTTRDISPSRRLLIAAILLLLCISLAISGSLVDTSMYEIMEGIICDRVHGADAGDRDCKDTDVQAQLSSIMGVLNSATMAPGLVFTVPYGALADRYGRIKILGLAMLGITLYMAATAVVLARPDVFSLKLIWLCPLFQAVGGGLMVANSMVYTAVADIATDEQRSSAFMYIGSMFMAGILIARPITYFVMNQSAWLAMKVGIVWLSITTVIAFCVPETLNIQAAVETAPVTVETPTDDKSKLGKMFANAKASLIKTTKTVRWLFWEQRLVGFLLIGLSFEILGKAIEFIAPQYLAKRYNLSYQKVGLVKSVDTITSLVLLLAILPVAGHLLTKKLGLSAREKDLRLAQASAVVAALGTLVVALSDNIPELIAGMVTFNLGGGYTFVLRGLMTSLVAGHSIGLMYSCIACVENVIFLVAPMFYAWLFNRGLESWIGLPYMVSGLILVAAAVLIGVIRASIVGDASTVGDGDETRDEARPER
ncbi:major facilitator superfamily domain-containing protein [Podospora aff. communis PSN243]|uniref:Major facilitator superfamily domain-containing protein n=1 Tax=Podospora aff. communis PSN243 TaxID=3040156 RepID=A0AAV9GQG3_9PEZI|nr:major facilitator superfamily domain-containing protein [Podospora aff. communis PSN243]